MMKCVSRTSGGIIKGHRRNPPEKVPNPPGKFQTSQVEWQFLKGVSEHKNS